MRDDEIPFGSTLISSKLISSFTRDASDFHRDREFLFYRSRPKLRCNTSRAILRRRILADTCPRTIFRVVSVELVPRARGSNSTVTCFPRGAAIRYQVIRSQIFREHECRVEAFREQQNLTVALCVGNTKSRVCVPIKGREERRPADRSRER